MCGLISHYFPIYCMIVGEVNYKQVKVLKKQHVLKGPIYSVVDLETTGTSVKNGDRIIQIGCVLVQAGQVINSFETKINPLTRIPHNIEQLTGIKNSDVQNAPLFDDVAASIESLLSNTIFVAHNVDFDFPFLNHELVAAGYEPLKIKAIDTVTLSQILMPTAKSYRLRDLTNYLHIEHDHPHSAVSDAEATGHLLTELIKRLRQLPTVTLQKIVNLHLQLPEQTAQLFKDELRYRNRHPLPLTDDLYISHGMVLHKIHPAESGSSPRDYHYPLTKRQKLRAYGNTLTYRPLQSRMMNSIYNYFGRDGVNQVVLEAGTGVGKTLGYLFPLSFLAYPQHKIVVSTATNVLQQQLIGTPIQQLNQVLPFKMTAVMVKGDAHYINLSKFVHSLSINENSHLVQLLKARILVWLLSTTTGDMDELNLNAHRSPLFMEIAHHGVKSLAHDDPFYADDFLVRREQRLQNANIIITNHAYLVAHARELGATSPLTYLVVDEAQHLNENALKHSRTELRFQRLFSSINQLNSLVSDGDSENLADVFNDLPLGRYNLDLIHDDLDRVREGLNEFQVTLYRDFLNNVNAANGEDFIEVAVDNEKLLDILDPESPLVMELESGLASLQLHFTALRHLFNNHPGHWLTADRYLMNQFASQVDLLLSADEQLHSIIKTLSHEPDSAVYWLTVRQFNERSTMRLSGGLLVNNHYLRENVYAYFYRQLFVGATLFTSHRSTYLYQQLDLDAQKVKSKRLPVAFDFKNNASLLIAQDAPAPDKQEYLQYLSDTIYQLADATQCQTMVLFNSLVTIEQVYSLLHKTPLFDQRDILAQGINGNREKILKQFATGTNSVLLGASSFWEGIDLPEDQLQMLIVTRLPFDAPNEIYTKAEHQLLRAQGKNPFYQSELPKAIIRMRQGMGRLLRTPKDYGLCVVLDSRLASRRYGKTIQRSLPDELPIETLKSSQLPSKAKKFLKKHHGVSGQK